MSDLLNVNAEKYCLKNTAENTVCFLMTNLRWSISAE